MWKITAQSDNDAEILLYDIIGDYSPDYWDYNGAASLIRKIKGLGNVQKFTLRINSVGGDVFEAHAMYSYLKNCSAEVVVYIVESLKHFFILILKYFCLKLCFFGFPSAFPYCRKTLRSFFVILNRFSRYHPLMTYPECSFKFPLTA